jgi:hypothetical protein
VKECEGLTARVPPVYKWRDFIITFLQTELGVYMSTNKILLNLCVVTPGQQHTTAAFHSLTTVGLFFPRTQKELRI